MKNPFLVYQAKSFYNAYIALEQVNADGDELLLMVPRMVNGVFSAELTIKAILTEQGIPYSNEHNLKILFEKLPLDIQNRIWEYLAQRTPEYADAEKREKELLLMSEAFVQWRYCFEGNGAPSFDLRFLSVFANSVIFVMFDLGYNVFFTKQNWEISPAKADEINRKIEDNREFNIMNNQEIIRKKSRRGKV